MADLASFGNVNSNNIGSIGAIDISKIGSIGSVSIAPVFSISPTSFSFDFEGSPCTIDDLVINVPSGVRWTIKNYLSWISPSLTTGTGPAIVSIAVGYNSGSARFDSTIDVSIATDIKTFSISQLAFGGVCS
jgi:hypothetical protein